MRARHTGLDDLDVLHRGDPAGMLAWAADLPRQLRAGYRIGVEADGLPSGAGVRAVVVCGMGGSGVVGDILRAIGASRLSIPVVVSKGYAPPAFCGPDTLVLASSFSGNTEETLAAYAQALSRGARVVAASAGGELAALCRSHRVPHLSLPDDVPMPRAALGYLAGAPFGVLEAMGLLPGIGAEVGAAAATVEELGLHLGPERSTPDNQAKVVAERLVGRVPVVWGSEGPAEAAAVRWKTQLNENAKVPAFHSMLPELDHNEVEGWSEGSGSSFALVVLRHPDEGARVAARVDATLESIDAAGLDAVQVHARPGPPLAAVLSLVMVGDFASTYLAVLRGVDPTPIPTLTRLKERLRG